jgi:hypothetical protein
MTTRHEIIRSTVNGILQEAFDNRPGFWSGTSDAYNVTRQGGKFPKIEKPDMMELVKQENELISLLGQRYPKNHPNPRLQKQPIYPKGSDGHKQIKKKIAKIRLARKNFSKIKADYERYKTGVVAGKVVGSLVNFGSALGTPIVSRAGQRAFDLAGSGDAGTMTGKGYQV